LQILPIYLLAIFITLPLAIQAVLTTLKNYDNERAIIPAQAKTILLTLSSGIVIVGGYIVDKFV